MEYREPLLSLIALLAWILWSFDYWKIFRKPLVYLPKTYQISRLTIFRLTFFALGSAAWFYLAIALMGPRIPHSYTKSKIEVNDIFLVVDVSRSMLADDFKPNRLEVAKNKILEFTELRPTDRIGIVTFSEKAFTLLPLTTDLDLIRRMVSDIDVGFLGSGTNIGDALGLAVGRLVQSVAKNKIIILLTDGVNNVGNITPTQAANEARDQKVKIYTIGIGTDENAQIPVGRNMFGQQYQNIPGGSIDEKSLQEISETTGGKSYLAANEKALKDVLSIISKLEKTEIEHSGKIVYEELYLKYLIRGFFILVAAEILRRVVLREVA